MCGIMGYVGREDAWDIVVSGLRRLEYRGYDSAGVVTVSEKGLHLGAAWGTWPRCRKRTLRACRVRSASATRAGRPTAASPKRNCHPHVDLRDRIAIVHNGIVDNVEALRAELVAAGVKFRSETDTEVLAELIGRGLDSGLTLRDAVSRR